MSFRPSFENIMLSTKLQYCGLQLYTQNGRSLLSSADPAECLLFVPKIVLFFSF